jgi:hypothetical protein
MGYLFGTSGFHPGRIHCGDGGHAIGVASAAIQIKIRRSRNRVIDAFSCRHVAL